MKKGLRYHHLGVPTTAARRGERHVPHLKVFIVGHEQSDFGIEWIRFEPGTQTPELVRSQPHVAFEVDDLDAMLAGLEVIIPPNSPSDGVRVAFIVEKGLPIELMQFTDPDHPDRNRE